MLAAYIGAGLGGALSYAGTNYKYEINLYFNPVWLWNEILNNNALIFVGIFAGLGTALFVMYLIKNINDLKEY